jgi:hypothetical protein
LTAKKPGSADKPAEKPQAAEAKKPAAAKPAGSSAEAIRAAAAAKSNGHDGKLPSEFAVGARIRYKDNGDWITGTLKSLEPAVLILDDQTQIRTTTNVLRDAIAEGLIVRA